MEKLKIYVTRYIADIIEKDAEAFEFFKRDGITLNKNALLSQLIVNYHNKFSAEQDALLGFLKERISTAVGDNAKLDGVCFDICERINKRNAAPNDEKFDVLLHIKPTKQSEPVLEYIERYSLAGRTLSEYFRSMLASYAAMPQNKREEIIFKPQYDAVLRAIKEKKKVFITLNNGRGSGMEAAPYAIAGSKEELHLYVLAAEKTCAPIRLSRVASVKQLNADAVFDGQQLYLFDKMLKYGPQFIYRPFESEAMVELTDRGVEKYKKIYVHRPVPVKIVKNYYYFECSHTQLLQYFTRFGNDAKIIYPQSLRRDVCAFHRRALEQYDE